MGRNERGNDKHYSIEYVSMLLLTPDCAIHGVGQHDKHRLLHCRLRCVDWQ